MAIQSICYKVSLFKILLLTVIVTYFCDLSRNTLAAFPSYEKKPHKYKQSMNLAKQKQEKQYRYHLGPRSASRGLSIDFDVLMSHQCRTMNCNAIWET